MSFAAFISYSHAADNNLAPAVQKGLHRIAKPWYRLRTMRVFRDQTNLGTNPGVWNSIESALRDSDFFYLFGVSRCGPVSLDTKGSGLVAHQSFGTDILNPFDRWADRLGSDNSGF